MSRSGIVALAGRPNVGKSTLLNALVGEKLSIVSDRPQTTRRAIRGVISRGDSQVVLVDLPGTQRPRDPLTARLAKRVQQELEGADGVLLMLNGAAGRRPRRPPPRRLRDGWRGAGDDRRQQGGPAVPPTAHAGPRRRRRAGPAGGDLPDLGPAWDGRRRARGPPRPERPRGPVPVRARRQQRPAARAAAGGADPRGGDPPHLSGGPPCGRGGGRGHRPSARGADPRTRPDLGRERLPEGDPDRLQGQHDQGDRDSRPAGNWSASWTRTCTSTCPYGCAAGGATTRPSSTASG